ncbi:MAG: sulfite exporter TauE/SafE family protein [Gemmataceae bacterium]
MIEWLAIFIGGLLGSAHCVGMCGAFTLTLGSTARSWHANAVRQVVYSAGRIAVYAFAGAVAGYAGWKLGRDFAYLVHAQAVLAMIAGVLLIVEGLFSAGILRRPGSHAGGCAGVSAFASMLRAPKLYSVFAAGMLNGLLPCGLVYAYLAFAAAAGSVHQCGLVMLVFGVGTIPALLLTGMSGSLLGITFRRRLFRFAAWCMIATGVISIHRGVVFLQTEKETPVCPYCTSDSPAASE